MKEELKLDNITIQGTYPKDNNPIIFIANHTCIRDVFYMLKAINQKTIVLASSNSVYKKAPKEAFMKKYLYMLPVEIYGDTKYTELLLQKSTILLEKKQNIIMFPEGVYSVDQNINRAHTMTSRMILEALDKKIKVHLIPISIKIIGPKKDKASIDFSKEHCNIHILKEIKTEKYYQQYKKVNTRKEKNKLFHELIDSAMISIANDLNVGYKKEYRPYVSKEKIVTLDGTIKDIQILQNEEYYNLYKKDVEVRLQKIILDKD